jgi:hypothetical protein
VATSTNLAGFIRAGVFSPVERRAWNSDPVLKWAEGPSGQHIELGISEMNLFLLLGQLGLSWDLSAQPLIPVGTVYDPFVLRGLDAFIYGTYSGARFIVAGTPSGVTLAPEGGAHQSTMTPSVGLELPGVTLIEPAYATALDWLLCDAVGHVASGPTATRTAAPYEEGAYYLRLTTRPIDQAPFEAARARLGDAVLRRQVLAGAYRLVDAFEAHPELAADDGVPVPTVNLVAHAAPGGAHGDDAERARRAARSLPRRCADRHSPRCGIARDGVAGFRPGRPECSTGGGRVRTERHRPRALRAARPAPGLDRQRGAGSAQSQEVAPWWPRPVRRSIAG